MDCTAVASTLSSELPGKQSGDERNQIAWKVHNSYTLADMQMENRIIQGI